MSATLPYTIEITGTATRTDTPTSGVVCYCYGLYPSMLSVGEAVEFLSGDSANTGRRIVELKPRVQEYFFPDDMADCYALLSALAQRFVWVKITAYETGGLPSDILTNTWLKAVAKSVSVEHDDEQARKSVKFTVEIPLAP